MVSLCTFFYLFTVESECPHSPVIHEVAERTDEMNVVELIHMVESRVLLLLIRHEGTASTWFLFLLLLLWFLLLLLLEVGTLFLIRIIGLHSLFSKGARSDFQISRGRYSTKLLLTLISLHSAVYFV